MVNDAVTMTVISVLAMTPVLSLPAFGELLSQKSGVLSLGIEGIMAVGAIFANLGILLGMGSWGSIFIGILSGMAFGILFSFLSEKLKLDQVVTGFGVWFLGLGVSATVFTLVLSGRELKVTPIPPVLFSLDPIFYFSIGMIFFLLFFFSKTTYGLSVRASGEYPRAADSAGINVDKVRALCNILGSGLMGLGGAYLAINILQGFTYSMIAGYGWIAFALVIFGRWKPHYIFLGSLLFTAITVSSSRLQILGFTLIPSNYVVVLPHLAVIIGLTAAMLLAKGSGMPAALGEQYKK